MLSVGAVDSVNPTTVVPALFLAARTGSPRRVAGFALGVLAVNLAAGGAILIAASRLVAGGPPHLGARATHVLELVVGVVALVAAGIAWRRRHVLDDTLARRARRLERAAPLVGAVIAAVELPTAVPYLGVLAAVVDSRPPLATQLALALAFNLVFVAPVLVIAALARRIGAAGRDRSELRSTISRYSGAVTAIALLAVGGACLALGGLGAGGLT